MIVRHYLERLHQLLGTFPIVCVLGPRQCGKTTFIKSALAGWQYLDMEKPSDAIRMSEDPEESLRLLKQHFILDEAQRLPALFPVLRSFVDQNPNRKGQAVLLGSASLSLIKQISESLAGRVGFLDMTPFQWDEVHEKRKSFTLNNLWYRGGFPNVFLKSSETSRADWFEFYTRTFIERDLSVLGIDVSAPQMRRLWTMLAHMNGGVWNASQIGAALGTSYHTINRYTDILEQTFLLRKLHPYFANIGKRIVKSPKVYFRDTGLLHFFLGLREHKILDVHPARGASWEAFVIEHVVTSFQRLSPGIQGFYWRTASGQEADLLIERGDKIIPFEIKLHSSPGLNEASGLRSCMKDLNIRRGYVLSRTKTDYSLGHGIKVLSFENLLAIPERLLDL